MSVEVHLREKRILSEEVVDLKKRLDDSLTEITRKQAELTQTQADLQDALKKHRTTQRTVDLYQTQVNCDCGFPTEKEYYCTHFYGLNLQ